MPNTLKLFHHSDDSLTIDIGDMGEDLLVGQTLKRPLSTSHILEEQKHTLKKGPYRESRSRPDEVEVHRIFGDILDQGTLFIVPTLLVREQLL